MKKVVPCSSQSAFQFAKGAQSWRPVPGLQHLVILDANAHFFSRLFLSEPPLVTNFYQVLSGGFKEFGGIRHPNRIRTLLRRKHQRRVGNRLTPAYGLVRTLSLAPMLRAFVTR